MTRCPIIKCPIPLPIPQSLITKIWVLKCYNFLHRTGNRSIFNTVKQHTHYIWFTLHRHYYLCVTRKYNFSLDTYANDMNIAHWARNHLHVVSILVKKSTRPFVVSSGDVLGVLMLYDIILLFFTQLQITSDLHFTLADSWLGLKDLYCHLTQWLTFAESNETYYTMNNNKSII